MKNLQFKLKFWSPQCCKISLKSKRHWERSFGSFSFLLIVFVGAIAKKMWSRFCAWAPTFRILLLYSQPGDQLFVLNWHILIASLLVNGTQDKTKGVTIPWTIKDLPLVNVNVSLIRHTLCNLDSFIKVKFELKHCPRSFHPVIKNNLAMMAAVVLHWLSANEKTSKWSSQSV